MPPHSGFFARFFQLSFTVVFALAGPLALSQTPQVTVPDPAAESFLGEEYCFDATFSNTGDVGYGPYLRVLLPPELATPSASIFGVGGSFDLIDTFPEAPAAPELEDPRTEAVVTGASGFAYYNLTLPVGSVVEDGPPLDATICATISPDAIVGTPLDISLTPVYEFGDTPTGDNGPIVGAEVEPTVTPTVLLFEKTNNAPEAERPPSNSWPYTYTLTVDLANTAEFQPIAVEDQLPAALQYLEGSASVSGGADCTFTELPSGVSPGGTLRLDCAGPTVGTAASGDIVVTYQGFVTDVLDEAACSSEALINSASVDATYVDQDGLGNVLPPVSDTSSVQAKHVAIQKSASPGEAVPGDTVTFTLSLQVTDHSDLSALSLTDIVGDGLDVDTDSVMFTIDGGAPIAVVPVVTVGDTATLDMDLLGAFQSETGQTAIAAGSAIDLSYTVTVRETYRETSQPVLAADTLSNNVVADYDLTGGATNCQDTSGASVSVRPTLVDKSIVNSGDAPFQPGDIVVYRLTLDVPSGDTQDIRFTDFLPLPALPVGGIDAVYSQTSADCPDSAGLCRGPGDTLDITPAITVDAATNSITLDWQDIDTTADQRLQVDLHVPVSGEPYADGLFLTNILQVSTSNSPGTVALETSPVGIQTRAPVLEIDKSVVQTSNTDSSIDGNGDLSGADAEDEVTYAVALTNTGGAPAFDIRVDDLLAADLDSCTFDGVTVGGSPRVTSLTEGAAIPALSLSIDGQLDPEEVAVVRYTCTIAGDVNPRQVIDNTATADWTAESGGTPFPVISDDASVSIAAPALAKTSTDISPGPAASGAVPGDTVTYQLTVTVPEGSTPAVLISEQLPAGLSYVDGSLIVDAAGFSGSIADTSPSNSGTLQEPAFNFGNVSATGSTGTADNSFLITYEALVDNDAANSALNSPQGKTNTASLDFGGNPGGPVSASHSLQFREPDLALTKSFNPGSDLQAGQSVTISLVVRNEGTAPAFDIVVTDVLNDGTNNDLLDLGTVTIDTVPTGYQGLFDTDTVTFSSDAGVRLNAGASMTFTFSAQVREDVVTGSTFTNTATVLGDSQDGVVPGERTTQGNDESNAVIRTPAVAKSVLASSEEWTTGTQAAIGEILTYQLVYTLPEGLTRGGAPAIFVDELPAGQQYLEGTATIRGTYDTVDGLSGSVFNTLPLADTPIVPVQNGQQLQFDIGDIQNDDNDVNDEQIVITFDVLVLNSADNNRGDTPTNIAQLNYLNRDGSDQSLQAMRNITIVEPNLSVAKSVDPGTASGGDPVTFTVVVGNANGGNLTRAWEPVLTDVLPARFQNVAIDSIQFSRGTDIDNPACAAVAGQALDVSLDCLDADARYLAPGETITVVYSATLDPEVAFEETVTNTATVTATSLPGSNGTLDAAPGDAGSGTGERTGEGGVNDLSANDSATVTSDRPSLTKTVADPALQIGETSEVTLTIPVPVGQTGDFALEDTLPAGLEYLGDASITLPAGVTASLEPSTPAAGTTPLVFDFGTVRNTADGSRNIVISYSVRVLDVANNTRGDTLTNTATLDFAGAVAPLPSDTATITVREPDIEMEKTITAGATGSTAGSSIGYAVRVTNRDENATAYRVELRDVLPAELLGGDPTFADIVLVNADGVTLNESGMSLMGGQSVIDETVTPDDTLTWPLFDMPPGSTLNISYTVVVADEAVVGSELTNTADITYRSTPEGDDGRSYNTEDSRTLTLDAAIALQKLLSPGQQGNVFTIGDTVDYDLRVDVLEGVTPTVFVTDTLPEGLSFVELVTIEASGNISYAGPAGAEELTPGVITLDFGDVSNMADMDPTNDTLTVRLRARVDNRDINQSGDERLNLAEVTSGIGDAHDDLAITLAEPALEVLKDVDNASPNLGDEVTFTLSVRHTGQSTADAFDVVVEDVLPAGLDYVDGSATPSPAQVDGNTLVWERASLTRADDDYQLTYQARVSPAATVGAPLSNNAALSFASQPDTDGGADGGRTGADGPGGALNDYAADASSSVTPRADAFLYAQKTVALIGDQQANGVADPGDRLEYTIELVNEGGNATGVVITDPVPDNTRYVSGSLTSTAGVVDDSGDPLVVSVGSLAGGAAVTVRFQVDIVAPLPGGVVISNQGLIDSDQTVPVPTDADGNPGNGSQPTDTVVGGVNEEEPSGPGLRFTKTFALTGDIVPPIGSINEGDEVTYTLVIRNTGDEVLTDVTFSDSIPAGPSPAGMTVTGVSVTQGTAPIPGNSVVINDIGSIAPGGSVTVRISGMVNGTGDILNQALVNTTELGGTPSDGDGNSGNGMQPTVVPVQPAGGAGLAKLSLDKQVELIGDANSDNQANPGETVRFTLRVRSTGSAVARDVRLVDAIADINGTLVADSVVTSQGSVVSQSPEVLVNLGDMPAGSEATVLFRIVAGQPGELNNAASVSDAMDNSSSDSASIPIVAFDPFDPPGGIKVLNEEGVPELEWTMVWLNPNASFVSPLLVIDPIPPNSQYVDGSLECIASGVSTTDECVFDEEAQEVRFSGFIGPDEGATGLDDASNAVVIRFRVEIESLFDAVVNQATGYGDTDGNGEPNLDRPVLTDDPDVEGAQDPTRWQPVSRVIPAVSYPLLALMVLMLAGFGGWRMHAAAARSRAQ